MPERQRQVLERILRCRTPALGGELFGCPGGGHFHYRYPSCHDRHGPQCGGTEADQWLEQPRQRLLLPVPYFLLTFTVPEALRWWIRSHPDLGYALLLMPALQRSKTWRPTPQRLGAPLGMLGILHTLVSRPPHLSPPYPLSGARRRVESGPTAVGCLAPRSSSARPNLWRKHFRTCFFAPYWPNSARAPGKLPPKIGAKLGRP